MDRTQQIIVLEAQPYWQPELQRRFRQEEDIDVRACRSISDLEQRVHCPEVSGVVLDLAIDVSGSLRWMGQGEERRGLRPVIVVAPVRYASLEWSVRELGATDYVDDLIGGHRMAVICRKTLMSRKKDRNDSPTIINSGSR